MFRYRLFWEDGSEAGEAEHAVNIKVGDLVWISRPNRQLRVLDLVPVEGKDSSYVGHLEVPQPSSPKRRMKLRSRRSKYREEVLRPFE